MNALVYIHKVINKMHESDAPVRELIKAGEELSIPWKAVDHGKKDVLSILTYPPEVNKDTCKP